MERWLLGSDEPSDARVLKMAGSWLRHGKLVAFPTETVYGLGANAFDEQAVQRVFTAKQRPVDNPLIVHISDVAQLDSLLPGDFLLSKHHRLLMDAFWPGPLTLLFPVGSNVAPSVHPGSDTVGVRMPNHPVARKLIAASECPIAAPSANTSGKPSPTNADAVAEDLSQAIDGLVDGGSCGIGVESTVLLIEEARAIILRPGGVTQEMIAQVIDLPVVYDAHLIETDTAPRAPGMKYRHYAPNARVHVWWGDSEEIHAAMIALLTNDDSQENIPPLRAAVIAPDDFLGRFELPLPHEAKHPLPADTYASELARELYHTLRHFDHAGMTDILIHGVDPVHGIGTAVMNRLQKAAEGRVARV